MLTLQQIHENNIVAKEYLKALIEINAEAKAEKAKQKELWKEAPFGIKCLMVLCNVLESDKNHQKFIASSMLERAERDLRNYFKLHYKYGKCHSGFNSPKIEISWISFGMFFNTKTTKKLAQVPHEV